MNRSYAFMLWLLPMLVSAQDWPRWQYELTAGKIPLRMGLNSSVTDIYNVPSACAKALWLTRNGRWGFGLESSYAAGRYTFMSGGSVYDSYEEWRTYYWYRLVKAMPVMRWNWLRKPGIQAYGLVALGFQHGPIYSYTEIYEKGFDNEPDSLLYRLDPVQGRPKPFPSARVAIGVNVPVTPHWSMLAEADLAGSCSGLSLGLSWTPQTWRSFLIHVQ